MSEEILKALMQLFALVAVPDQEAGSRRRIVKNYLSLHLNNQLIEEYLRLFDEHQQTYREKLKKKGRIPKLHAASSVKVLRIATTINEELTHYQKVIVVIQLLDFLQSGDKGISDVEEEFARTISETFKLENKEYLSVKDFVVNDKPSPQKNKDILIIGDNRQRENEERYIFREFINTEVYVLNIPSISLFLVKTLSSTELTINGQVLIPHQIHFLRPGGSIRYKLGTPVTFSDISIHFNYNANQSPIIFDVRDISFSFSAKKEAGLHPMSFTSHSGQLVGIMGDSGAGKSTLINVLTGIFPPSSGEILLNGIDLHLYPEKIKGLIGYVAQDDLLIEDLTVFQNLYYNTRLCFDDLSNEEITYKVDGLLKSLGLYEIQDMKVGTPLNKKISGGQRKRLNIALELVREPAVLFLDEPTSGLSSRDSENIMDLLKDLAVKGKLVYVVIHQPSSEIFKMFDQLLVLDNGGYLIYSGDPVGAINYFKSVINHANKDESECPVCGNVTPEQILNIVNAHVLDEYGTPTPTRKIPPQEWFHTFKKYHPSTLKREEKRLPLPDIHFQIPGKAGQFFTFFLRDVKAKLANLQYIAINLLEMPIMAVVLAGLLYYFQVGEDTNNQYIFYENPNLVVYLFISVIISIFVGLTLSAEEIINDRKILRREAFLNLSRLSYLLSKISILAIISAIQTTLLVLTGNSILQIKGMFIPYWLVLFSSAIFANLLGLLISDNLKKTVNIYILIPFLIIPQLILSGVFVSYDRLNPNFSSVSDIPWYGELITARWGFEALAVHQFSQNDYQKEFFTFEKLKSKATYRKDYWIQAMENELTRLAKMDEEEKIKKTCHLINRETAALKEQLPSKAAFKNLPSLPETGAPVPDKKIQEFRDFLNDCRNFYVNLYNEADKRMEKRRKEIIRNNDRQSNPLTELRNRNHNEALERFVRGTDNFFSKRIIKYDGRFIKKFDAIYKDPKNPFIKSHYLAHQKNVLNKKVPTLPVNIAVIWLFNILLFVLLYSEPFKKINLRIKPSDQ